MPTLLNHRGEPVLDANGEQIKAGATVVDVMFGEGVARGTVPLEKGDGVNVNCASIGLELAHAKSQQVAMRRTSPLVSRLAMSHRRSMRR